jgi:type IV pilus assembly protein PilX
MSRPALNSPAPAAQRGVMLIAVMILLVVATLLALGSFRLGTLEERMAGHTRDRQLAFQAAEAALRDAEAMILNNTGGPYLPLRAAEFDELCTGGRCRSSPTAPVWSTLLTDADWAGPRTWEYGTATAAAPLTDVAEQPRYVIEYQGTTQPIEVGKPCVAIFLITARARGADATSLVVLQSVFRLRAGECYAGV